jgi:hypothetical protein
MAESNSGHPDHESNPNRLATAEEISTLQDAIVSFSERSWWMPTPAQEHHRGVQADDGSMYNYKYLIHLGDPLKGTSDFADATITWRGLKEATDDSKIQTQRMISWSCIVNGMIGSIDQNYSVEDISLVYINGKQQPGAYLDPNMGPDAQKTFETFEEITGGQKGTKEQLDIIMEGVRLLGATIRE